MENITEKEPVLFTKDTAKTYSLIGAIHALNPSVSIKVIEKKVDGLLEESISNIEDLNSKLKESDVGVSLRAKDIIEGNRFEEYMNVLNSGRAIIASCTLHNDKEEKVHYIALAKAHDEIVMMDPNTKLGYANRDILKDMLNEGMEIEYLGYGNISFNDSSIIVVEKV
jgi:hypothetical protein